MNTNFRELIGMPKLSVVLGVKSIKNDLNLKQKKAVRNFKYCSNDLWGYVNGWYDEHDESYREFLLSPKQVFNEIYNNGITYVYDEGSCSFNISAKQWLKDIRFCGKLFLQTIALYYTAKLIEEAFCEVGGTEEDAERIVKELNEIKFAPIVYEERDKERA